MSGGTVMTVLGPLPASDLGNVDVHDHLFLRSPAIPGQEFEDLEGTATEVRAAMVGGLRTIAEMKPVGCDRDPAKLRALSETTGLHVIVGEAATDAMLIDNPARAYRVTPVRESMT